MRLSDFKALSFDCYGTLIDWETGLLAGLRPLMIRAGMGDGEAALAAFGEVEAEVQRASPAMRYPDVLAEVHRRLAKKWGVPEDEAEAEAFGQSVGDWPAFPESADALAYLKRHFRLIILSNIDEASFALSNRRLRVKFDHVFTAEGIGSYKPDPANFEFLLERLAAEGVDKDELLHVAQSLYHDHVPANRIGLASAWIDRRHDKAGGGATPMPEAPVHYDFRFESLEALAAAHRAEQNDRSVGDSAEVRNDNSDG